MKKIIFKFFALCILTGGLGLFLSNPRIEAMTVNNCYNDHQSCQNDCAACQCDTHSCVVANCDGPYRECIMMLPMDNLNDCIASCPQCSMGDDECSNAYLVCKAACIDRSY